jgi:hypothetical protein
VRSDYVDAKSGSERQLIYRLGKWGLRKNADGTVMKYVACKQQERAMRQAAEPTIPDLKFTLRGEVLDQAKVARWKQRTGFSAQTDCEALESMGK